MSQSSRCASAVVVSVFVDAVEIVGVERVSVTMSDAAASTTAVAARATAGHVLVRVVVGAVTGPMLALSSEFSFTRWCVIAPDVG